MVVRGEGVYLYDAEGKQYLDGSGGAAISCLGHGNRVVIDAIKSQAETLAFAHTMFWGEGDGSTLCTFDTEIGKIGGLICWENYMPLARMAMYNKGVEIYLAPTADSRDSWNATCSISHLRVGAT